MPDSYTNLLYHLLYHLVFSTKDRQALITPDYEIRLHEYMGGILRNAGGISLALNGTEDHLHLLAKLRPDRAVSDLLRDLKSNSSGWLHDVDVLRVNGRLSRLSRRRRIRPGVG
ncbi:MAG: transposase [Acidobacteriota bacterium]